MRSSTAFGIVFSTLAAGCSGALDVGTSGGGPAPSPDVQEEVRACVPVGAARSVVQGNVLHVAALAVDGEILWFAGSTASDPPSNTQTIFKASIRGGEPSAVMTGDHVGVRLAALGDRLVYVHGKTQSNVIVRDMASGNRQTLENPRTTTGVTELLVHASGIYWGSREEDPLARGSIARWDPATGATTELTTLPNASTILTDGHEVFFARIEGGEGRFEAVAIAGGAPRIVRRFPSAGPWSWELVHVDARALYFTKRDLFRNDDRHGEIWAVDKDGANERAVASNVGFAPGNMAADATHLYWSDGGRHLLRVAKRGGTPEVVWSEPHRPVGAVVVDSCNVYWTVANPPAVYAKSR